MAINYSPIEFVGPAFQEIFMEVLFQNETISENKVRLLTDIKAETIITEMGVDVDLQAYVCGVPTPSGDITINDGILRPCKYMSYQEWCPEDLRFTRFSAGMRSGAWETINQEWVRIVMETYATKMSRKAEMNFWNGMTTATKAAVAAAPLAGMITAETKAYALAAPLTLCDGILSYLIYNNGAGGTAFNIAGTTIDATNIWDEYKLVYAAIPTVLLKGSMLGELRIYAPESHMQFINIYNTDQTFRDKFSVDNAGNYYFLGVKITFVPLPENTMIAGRMSDLIWGTDATSDFSFIQIDKVANNAETRFFKGVFTQGATVVTQTQKVVYVG